MTKIFIPYDFSKNAVNTLIYALKLTASSQAHIIVFHALSVAAKTLANAAGEEERKKIIAAEENGKNEELKKAVNAAIEFTRITVSNDRISCRTSFGPFVVESIVDAAASAQADLVLMGTHGATGLRKFLFGSVTSATIAKSDVPVLAIPEGHSFADVKTIAYASDLENFETELLQILPLSTFLGADLTVLHFDYGFKRQEQVFDVLERYSDSNIKLVVKKADASTPLLRQVRLALVEIQPQWLVMFTKERSMWDKLFASSKTEDMASDLQLPLLSFKKANVE